MTEQKQIARRLKGQNIIKSSHLGKRIISGEEFINKVLNGERDFRAIRFLRSNKLHKGKTEGYDELIKYLYSLSAEEQQNNPFLLDHSYFSYVDFRELFLPFVSARYTTFNRCKLGGAIFSYGDFSGAHFRKTLIRDVNFDGANLDRVTLSSKKFYKNEQFNFSDVRVEGREYRYKLFNKYLGEKDDR